MMTSGWSWHWIVVAEELESLCREGSGKPDSVKDSGRRKLYQLLTEGIPAMQKVAAVYISQSIKQMRVTKLPNIRLGVSLSAGLLNPGSGCGGDGSGAAF